MLDFSIEIQEYYWLCVREGLTEAQDEKDEEVKDLSPKQFHELICDLIEESGMTQAAIDRREQYQMTVKVTRKKGENFDKVINN